LWLFGEQKALADTNLVELLQLGHATTTLASKMTPDHPTQ
jgi:hypothetical protein